MSPQPLTGAHTLALARSIMNDKQAAEFEAKKECNFAIAPSGIGRFRVNCFVQQGQVGAVLRVITTTIPNFEDLKLAARTERRRDDETGPGAVRRRNGLG